QERDKVGILRAAPGGTDHGAVQPSPRRKDPRRIDKNKLGVAFYGDTANKVARGLHLRRDDRHFRADQRIDERGFSDIRRADQRHKTAALRGWRLFSHCGALARHPRAPAWRRRPPVRRRAWSVPILLPGPRPEAARRPET